AFEKKGPVSFLDLAKGAHRSERVADQLTIHRNQAVAPCQLQEFIKLRTVTHAKLQKSGVRNQGSGIRGQESGVRNQESGVRDQRSEVRAEVRIAWLLIPDSCLTPAS